MGPLGGGRLADLPRETAERLGIQVRSSAELALRFVFANRNVDCGEREAHCPQHIPIREQLKECLVLFHNYTQ